MKKYGVYLDDDCGRSFRLVKKFDTAEEAEIAKEKLGLLTGENYVIMTTN